MVRPRAGDSLVTHVVGVRRSLLFAHFPPALPLGELDHAVHYFGDVQFYRKHAWALTHPIAYAGYPNTGPGVNEMLAGGWGAPVEFRGALTQQDGPGYVYVAGTAGGDVLPAKYYDPPEHWWHEWSRSVLWLQGEPDILVVFDRSHAVDPRTLPKFTRYSAANQALMTSAGALKQVVFHAPVTGGIRHCGDVARRGSDHLRPRSHDHSRG